MIEEIWKVIEGYPNYQVSNKGRIKSTVHKKELILSPRKEWNGRLFVNLYKNKKMKSVKIHRLVAKAFIPNPENFTQINHKDENPVNNNVENLEWCDAKYNMTYNNLQSRQHLLQKRKIGAFDKNFKLLKMFMSATDAANYLVSVKLSKNFKSCIGNICYCAKRELNSIHYGFIWRYLEPSHRKQGTIQATNKIF